MLVEVPAAQSGAAETRYFHVFNRELIVVSQLLATSDGPQSEDNDVFPSVDEDDLRVAVRVTRVVDKPRGVPHYRRVDYVVGVFPEHVAADAA